MPDEPNISDVGAVQEVDTIGALNTAIAGTTPPIGDEFKTVWNNISMVLLGTIYDTTSEVVGDTRGLIVGIDDIECYVMGTVRVTDIPPRRLDGLHSRMAEDTEYHRVEDGRTVVVFSKNKRDYDLRVEELARAREVTPGSKVKTVTTFTIGGT